MLADKKIILVYDRVNTPYGGAEAVLLALKELYPQADLATSVYDARRAKWAQVFKIKTSFLQKIPLAKKHHRALAVLMPIAFETLDLSTYDIVISVTSAEAKGVLTQNQQFHFCYFLSPPRYLYHYRDSYLSKKIFHLPIVKGLAKLSLNYLSNWDQIAVHRPDILVPIAEVVKNRIKKYYQHESANVIYPPVNVELWQKYIASNKIKKREKYFLLVSRLVPYKKVDLAIKACIKTGQQLIIVGDGPEYKSLKNLINLHLPKDSKQILLLKNINNEDLSQLYSHAQALLMPGIDDFGITALEANLHGLPVIINQHSGASEIIEHGVHGLKLNFSANINSSNENDCVAELCHQMKKVTELNFDPGELQKNALKYDTTSFKRQFNQQLTAAYRKFENDR